MRSSLSSNPFLKRYCVLLPVLLALDLLWLGLVADDLYRQQIGALMAPSPNWPAALLFYLVYIGGVVHFVLMPFDQHRSVRRVVRDGALFGFVAYATFDLTSLALIRGWSTLITVVDLAWGATLTATAAWLTCRITGHAEVSR